MHRSDWEQIAAAMEARWGRMSGPKRDAYFTALRDLDGIAVHHAVTTLAAEDRQVVPPPAAIRERIGPVREPAPPGWPSPPPPRPSAPPAAPAAAAPAPPGPPPPHGNGGGTAFAVSLFVAPLGLVMGVLAYRRSERDPRLAGDGRGRGYAIAAICVGGVLTALAVAGIVLGIVFGDTTDSASLTTDRMERRIVDGGVFAGGTLTPETASCVKTGERSFQCIVTFTEGGARSYRIAVDGNGDWTGTQVP